MYTIGIPSRRRVWGEGEGRETSTTQFHQRIFHVVERKSRVQDFVIENVAAAIYQKSNIQSNIKNSQ